MGNIAKLSVSLEADISKFQEGMKKASSILSALDINMAKLAGKGLDVLVAASVASAAALGYLVQQSIESVTANTRLSDRLQISTEAMYGFQVAARSVGVDAETASGFLTHLAKSIGEAQNGSEEAQAKFEKLGLDLVTLSKATGAHQLDMVADAIKKVGSASGQAAAAMELGGRSGAQLVNVLNLGSEGLAHFSQVADGFGIALNRIDSAKIVEAHESFEQIKLALDGVITQITLQLSPFLAYFAQQFLEWAESSAGGVNSVGKAFEWLTDAIGVVTDAVHFMEAAFYAFRGTAILAVQAVIKTLIPFGSLIESIGEFTQGLGIEAKDAFKEAGSQLDKVNKADGVKQVRKWFADIRSDAEKAAKAIADGVDKKAAAGREAATVNAIKNANAKDAKEADKQFEEMRKKAAALSKSVSPFAKFKDEINDAVELFKKGFINAEIFGDAEKKAIKDFNDASNKDKPKNSVKEINTAFVSVAGLKEQKDKKAIDIHSPQLEQVRHLLQQIHSTLGVRNEGVVL